MFDCIAKICKCQTVSVNQSVFERSFLWLENLVHHRVYKIRTLNCEEGWEGGTRWNLPPSGLLRIPLSMVVTYTWKTNTRLTNLESFQGKGRSRNPKASANKVCSTSPQVPRINGIFLINRVSLALIVSSQKGHLVLRVKQYENKERTQRSDIYYFSLSRISLMSVVKVILTCECWMQLSPSWNYIPDCEQAVLSDSGHNISGSSLCHWPLV